MNPSSSPRRGVLVLAGTAYFQLAVSVVTGPVLARLLEPSGRGVVAAVTAYSGLAAALLSLGMAPAVANALTSRTQTEAQVTGVVWRFSTYLIVPSILAALCVPALLLGRLPSDARTVTAVLLGLSPFAVAGTCLTAVLIARADLSGLAKTRFVPIVVVALGVLVLSVTGTVTPTTYLLLVLGAGTCGLITTMRIIAVRPTRGGALQPLVRFGVRAYAGTLANLANAQLDQVLIAPFLGTRQLGLYAVSVTIANLPLGFAQAIAARTVGTVATGDNAIDLDAVARLTRLATATAAVGACMLLITAPIALPLIYGDAYVSSIVPLALLLPGMVATAASGVADGALMTAGRPNIPSRAELGAVGVTGVGLAIFLPLIGIDGAALVSSCAYIARAAVSLSSLRRMGLVGWLPRRDDFETLLSALTALVVRGAARRGGGR